MFADGYTSGGGTTSGHVLYFDGLGWTSSPLPMGVPRLKAVWALPTGEVFAVGLAGTATIRREPAASTFCMNRSGKPHIRASAQ